MGIICGIKEYYLKIIILNWQFNVILTNSFIKNSKLTIIIWFKKSILFSVI